MSLINRPLPGLFGGVSQQVPQLRDPTQCSEQINAYATLADGLNKRPGTTQVGDSIVYITPPENPFKDIASHIIDQGEDGRFLVLLLGATDEIRVFNLETRAEHTVTVASGGSYLAAAGAPRDAFRFCTVADHTFISNREQIVTAVTTDTTNDNKRFYARVTAMPGANISYTINCDGATYTATSVATDTTDSVAQALATGLGGLLGGGYTVSWLGDGVVSVVRAAGALTTYGITDGWGAQATVNLSIPVTSLDKLSPRGYGPSTITIQPNAVDSSKYYVRWDSTTARYVETRAPKSQVNNLSASTMPHVLVRTGATSWTFKTVDITLEAGGFTRAVGDDDSNPVPTFVGRAIDDIFFFRNRLGVISGDAVCLTRAGKYFAWFSESARDVLDTDPIDIVAASPDVNSFYFAVPSNDQLLIFSGTAQWTLTGGDLLTPKTAKLTLSTRYDVSTECRPILMGNDAYFLSALTSTSRVNRYQVADNGVSSFAGDVTDHVPDYLEKSAIRMVGSPTMKMLLVLNRDNPHKVDVLKFEMDGAKMVQRSWGKWIIGTTEATFADGMFPGVINAHFVGSRLYMVVHRWFDSAPSLNGHYTIECIDFDDVRVPQVGSVLDFTKFNIDQKCLVVGTGTYTADPVNYPDEGGYTEWTLPYKTTASNFSYSISGGLPSGVLSYPVGELNNNPFTPNSFTAFRLPGDWTGSVRLLNFGTGFTFRYRLSPVVMKDGNGIPIASSRINMKRYLLQFENSGYFKVDVTPYKRGAFTYAMSGYTVGSTFVNQYGLASGTFVVPVHTKQDGLTIDLSSNLHLPVKIPYAEWEAQLVQRSQR